MHGILGLIVWDLYVRLDLRVAYRFVYIDLLVKGKRKVIDILRETSKSVSIKRIKIS